MSAEEKNSYFKELALNLQREGFAAGQSEDGFLPVELEGRQLCLATDRGSIRYYREDAASEDRSRALDKVISLVETTFQYMSQMEAAPRLTASSLSGDFRLLADFNDTVLAGHPTEFGVQFITWDWVHNRTALEQGNFYGPGVGARSYTAAKQDFATRSGLIPHDALFTPEQMTEVYRSVCETLESAYFLTDKRRNLLESVAKQIEYGIPDLDERVSLSNQQELEQGASSNPDQDGIQFR